MRNREVFMSVGKRQGWVKAPDNGVAMPNTNWGISTPFVSGAVGIVGSKYGAKRYSLSWSFLRRSEFEAISRLFDEAGTEKVFYADPFASDNSLSKLAGHPYLLAESYSKLAFDVNGTATAEVVDIGSEPYYGLRVKTAGEVYTERITVPPDHSVSLARSGDNLVKYRWGTSGAYTTLSAPITLTPTGENTLEIAIGGAVGTLNWVRAVLHKTGNAPADIASYKPPRGGGNLALVPGSFQVTGISAAHGEYSVSIELQEVWSWL